MILLLVPGVAAAARHDVSGSVRVAAMTVPETATVAGEALFLGAGYAPRLTMPGDGWEFTARRVVATETIHPGYAFVTTVLGASLNYHSDDAEYRTRTFENVSGSTTGVGHKSYWWATPNTASGTAFDVSLRHPGLSIAAVPDVAFHSQLEDSQNTNGGKPGHNTIHYEDPNPSLQITQDAFRGDVTLTGDFTIELDDIDVKLTDANGSSQTIRSGNVRSNKTGAPPYAYVASDDNVTVSYEFQDATLQYRAHGKRLVQLNLRTASVDAQGRVVFDRATGAVETLGNVVPVRDQSLTLAGSVFHADLVASRDAAGSAYAQGRFRGSVDEVYVGDALMPFGASPKAPGAGLASVFVGVAMLLMGIVAILVMRRWRGPRSASLMDRAHVALAGGRPRRAYALARRALRREPSSSQALAAAFAALRRMNRPHQALALLEAHPQATAPATGFGALARSLALSDLGSTESALRELASALRLNPELEAEIIETPLYAEARKHPATKRFLRSDTAEASYG